MKTYKIIAINGDVDFCQECGKRGLERVVWLEDMGGNIIHTGTTCAAKLAGKTVKEQKAAEKSFVNDTLAAINAVLKPYWRAFDAVVRECTMRPGLERLNYLSATPESKAHKAKVVEMKAANPGLANRIC